MYNVRIKEATRRQEEASLTRTTDTAKVAVIGAGPGGLAAAMLLAADGYEVDLYEQQAAVGGRSAELTLGDYRFDRGPPS